MFQITMLPAREGDSLWISYGRQSQPRHILIDGGRKATYDTLKEMFAALPESQLTLELLVISHIDRDHIEGILELLDDPDRTVRFKDIWFNTYDHLQDSEFETFGARQAERLTSQLLAQELPWNEAFGHKAVEVSEQSSENTIELSGGLKITLVSPDREKLEDLIPVWDRECKKAGLIPGVEARREEIEGFESFGRVNIDDLAEKPFKTDGSEANGSSIAFLMEYRGKRILMSGDAHVDQLVKEISPLANEDDGRLKLDAFKVPHHGSPKNISKELLQLIDCPRYLISTNGSYFKHPHSIAISRLIKYGGQNKELIFNYWSDETKIWDNPSWKTRHGYQTTYPNADENGVLTIEF